MMIGTNNAITLAYNNLSATNKAMEKTARALSTGLRAATAADDAAGFAIGMNISANIAGVSRAIRNAQDGMSMLQTAEGGLNQINSMLQRMRELSIQAANDTLTMQDRNYIQMEIDELRENVNNIASNTTFNNKRLLDGSSAAIWSSDNASTKLKINGALTAIDQFGQKKSANGNYRIEINAAAGQGQVQKSSPMIISHKDVAMDRSIDTATGVNSLRISNLPAGHYTITDTPPTEARAMLTGSYGINISELDGMLKADVRDSQLTSNASILFEVTNASDGAVTLRATGRLLHTNGTTENVVRENITLSEGNTINLGETLGLGGDDAFALTLDDDTAAKFEAGYKFVYNLNVAKDVDGADRLIGIDGGLEGANEIIKTNSFKPKEKIEVSARVLFLIDDSGSMDDKIETVKSNITTFINKINANGADEVYVGVASYSDRGTGTHELRVHTVDGGQWSSAVNTSTLSSVIGDITDALNDISTSGGSVDHYDAIQKAISSYSIPADTPTFFVLVTDTGQEMNNGVTQQDAIDAMNNLGINCSVIRPQSASSVLDELATETDGLTFNQSEASWGTKFSNQLGQKIGNDAVMQILGKETPLSEFEQLAKFFPGNNPVTIEVIQNGKSKPVTIYPNYTMEELSNELDKVTGGSTTASTGRNDDGDHTITLTTSLPENTRISFNGNQEFLNALGFRSNIEQKFSLDASEVKDKNLHFRSFYLDSTTGQVYDSSIILTTDDDTELEEWSKHADFEASYIGQIPEYDVSLRDINTFYNAESLYMFDTPQKITLTQGDGKQTSITVYAEDTLEDLRAKLNDAIADGLGQKSYTDNRDNFVSFVREGMETSGGSESVAGTFVIRSAVAGSAGKITLSSDNTDLINALGLNTITEARENTFLASVYDAHTGAVLVNNLATEGNSIYGVISPNVEVEFDSMANVKAVWNDKTKSYDLRKDIGAYSTTIHISDRSTSFQVGSRDGEDMYIDIADMRAEALGLNRVDVSTRERASESIRVLDAAIRKVSIQRTTIGSYQNELEYNYNSLTQTHLHLQESESRIKDADMAKEMMEFIKLQILSNTGSSMLASANQNSQAVMNMLNM